MQPDGLSNGTWNMEEHEQMLEKMVDKLSIDTPKGGSGSVNISFNVAEIAFLGDVACKAKNIPPIKEVGDDIRRYFCMLLEQNSRFFEIANIVIRQLEENKGEISQKYDYLRKSSGLPGMAEVEPASEEKPVTLAEMKTWGKRLAKAMKWQRVKVLGFSGERRSMERLLGVLHGEDFKMAERVNATLEKERGMDFEKSGPVAEYLGGSSKAARVARLVLVRLEDYQVELDDEERKGVGVEMGDELPLDMVRPRKLFQRGDLRDYVMMEN